MNDVKRAADSVLSGLTATPEMQENLIRTAMQEPLKRSVAGRCPRKRTEGVSANDRVKLKLNFSLSFGLPHMVVAAIVIIVVMIAPLFAPGARTIFKTWQSEDGEYYMVQGIGKENNENVVEAGAWPTEEGVFDCKTIEEANQRFGTGMPIITWMPEGWTADMYTVSALGSMRTLTASYQNGETGRIVYTIYENRDGLSYTYVEQDGEGEHVKLSDGREVYVTTNMEWQSVAWMQNDMQLLVSGSITREEAIRMAESVKIP